MVFHVPYPLNPDAVHASGVRPVRMRRAFEEIGYRVFTVAGVASERKKAMAEVRDYLAQGGKISFCYSETSTMATLLTEPHHLPTHPLADFGFFRYLRRRGIPTGVFYRDIYWRFPLYRKEINPLLDAGLRAFYKLDLRLYRALGLRLYLPSLAMGKYVPTVRASQHRPLPPGADIIETPAPAGGLHALFVGGLGENYRLQSLVKAFTRCPRAELTLCVPPEHWEVARDTYEPLMGPNVRVVHAHGEELDHYYRQANIALLFTEPIEYWEFAMPVKLFEYLGRGKPIIATRGLGCSQHVSDSGAGWVIDYGEDELVELLEHLGDNPGEIEQRARCAVSAAHGNTWEARARYVARDLAGEGAGA